MTVATQQIHVPLLAAKIGKIRSHASLYAPSLLASPPIHPHNPVLYIKPKRISKSCHHGSNILFQDGVVLVCTMIVLQFL